MVDDLFGKLLTRLEDGDLLDDTLIIYCSDHGEMMGSHGLWHKMAPYEECLRVPLLMRLPGRIPAGLRSNATVSLIDVPQNEPVVDAEIELFVVVVVERRFTPHVPLRPLSDDQLMLPVIVPSASMPPSS